MQKEIIMPWWRRRPLAPDPDLLRIRAVIERLVFLAAHCHVTFCGPVCEAWQQRSIALCDHDTCWDIMCLGAENSNVGGWWHAPAEPRPRTA